MRTIRWRAALTVAVLGLTVWILWLAGLPLGTPPVRSWAGASSWYELVGPGVAFVSVVRVAALGVAVWLLAAATLQLLAAVLPRPSVRLVADLIAPRSLQRLVHGLAGLSLAAGLAVPAPSAGILDSPGDGVAVLQQVEDPPPGGGTATMHLVPDPAASDPSVPHPSVPDPSVPAAALPRAPSLPLAPAATPPTSGMVPGPAVVVVVDSGDSLWSIAEGALLAAGNDIPSDVAIERYWRRVIEANRSGLVEPTNPDLIYPGHVITLPER